MDENILPATVLSYEPKSFVGIVPFNRANAFFGCSNTGLSLRRLTRGRAPRRGARHLSCTRVHLNHFGHPYRAFLALAYLDLDGNILLYHSKIRKPFLLKFEAAFARLEEILERLNTEQSA